MTERTTPARYSLRLQNIQKMFDKFINNKTVKSLPALYDYDYSFYLESVMKENPIHTGEIHYKGFEVRRTGR